VSRSHTAALIRAPCAESLDRFSKSAATADVATADADTSHARLLSSSR